MTRTRPWTIAALLLLGAGSAHAQETTVKDGSLGAGIVVGSPTGFTAKWMADKNIAFDFAVGIGFGNDLHLHADWIYEGDTLLAEEGATLAWFAGVGGRFEFDDDDERGNNGNGNNDDDGDDDMDLGPRVPVGLELRFDSVKPLELFAEVALGIEVIDDTGLTLDAGIGARWFF